MIYVRNNNSYLAFIISFYISVFYPLLEGISGLFKFWDESIVVLFLILLVIKPFKKKYIKQQIVMVYAAFLVVGFTNTIVFHLQPTSAVLEDIVSFLKFPLAICFSYILFDLSFIEKYRRRIRKHVNFVVILWSVLLMINQIANIFPTVTVAIPIFRGESLFYSHTTYFAAAIVYITCILFLLNFRIGTNKIIYGTLLILGLSTTRSKMYGWIIVILLLYYLLINNNKKIKIKYLVIFGAIGAYCAKDKIIKYFITYKDAARGLLYSTSWKVFKDYFPLGSGYGTFATGASRKTYSLLYSQYGLSTIYGFSNNANEANYISDTFWPIIIAEFGIMGIVLFAAFLFMLYLKIQTLFKKNIFVYFSAMAALLYLIICSISESAFVNPVSVPLGFVIGIALKYGKRD